MNRRVYSCILLRNDIPFRWRGELNDDTDLSLRILKSGWCSILFQAFLADKKATMTVPGGLADSIYKMKDARLKGSTWLAEQHPDVASVVWKWGRWHHYVDYSGFKSNRLRLRPGVSIPVGPNEYGMRLDVNNNHRKTALKELPEETQ